MHTGDDNISNPKKDFEFDRVYGPHVAQGKIHILFELLFSLYDSYTMVNVKHTTLFVFAAELFNDVQPFVQSAFDGYNVSVFAYGQTNSGKTHTMVSFSPSPVCMFFSG